MSRPCLLIPANKTNVFLAPLLGKESGQNRIILERSRTSAVLQEPTEKLETGCWEEEKEDKSETLEEAAGGSKTVGTCEGGR